MTFPHTLLVRSLIIAISTAIPIQGWAESFVPPLGVFSESLTVNYSLAIRGGHANIPSERQSSPSRAEGSTYVFHSFPKTLNTQSSSSVQEQLEEEQRPSAFTVVVDEEVPSYIIHEPALRHRESATPEVVHPAFDEQYVQEQTSNDSHYSINTTTFDQPPPDIQRDRLSSLPLFGWPLIEQDHYLTSLNDSLAISPEFPFEATITGLSKPKIYLARFVDVLNSDWEPVASETFHEYGTIPLVINDAVAKNLRYFQQGITDRFQSYLDRFHHYKEIVEPIFQEFGLPTDLMYLSLVESGFNPRAFSRARASGPWQFMKATGRMYKLNVNWYVDERRDPIKSTVAAAHHLRDLYDRFGSWPLALAAYNAGSGKVSRAIRKTGSRDFWKIRRTWYIRRETKDYVPRFIAATLIAKNPTAYGFLAPEGDR
ncbi:MAG: lytic transglycosylase domain-containing protein, partial [Nitrospirota bacterium]